jgi:cell division protein ZapA
MEKANTQVLIGGKIFNMSGNENEEYMQKIAAYLNRKITSIEAEFQEKRIPQDMRNLLIQINIADELMKEREIAASMETDLKSLQEELNIARQEIASLQTQIERMSGRKNGKQK